MSTMLLIALLMACAVGKTLPETAPEHDWPAECPDPNAPDVRYMHATWADRGQCHLIDFVCEPGWDYIGGEDCGCGCRKN